MDFAMQLASMAPCSSKHGIVSCFSGACVDFAAMNFTAYVLSPFHWCMWVHAPNASCDASAKTHSIGIPQHWIRLGIFRRTWCPIPSFLETVKSNYPKL